MRRILLAIAAVWLVSCQTIPPATLPDGATPAAEIERTRALEATLVADQAHVLAPDRYQDTRRWLQTAEERRASGHADASILEAVARAQGHARQAQDAVALAQTAAPDLLTARRAAIDANARALAPAEMAEADDALREVGRSVQRGDVGPLQARAPALADRYRAVRVRALKLAHVGPARDLLTAAMNEGGERFAPRSIEAAREAIAAADTFVERHPDNAAGIASTSRHAIDMAARSVEVTRAARAVDPRDAEAVVLEREAREAELAAQRDATTAAQEAAVRAQEAVEVARSRRMDLESEVAFNQRFDDARARFSTEEAEVWRQGNQLVIRLRGLAFRSGDAEIPSASFELLGKVRGVINDFAPARVRIEGHTDTVGPREGNVALSQRRAEAVLRYLRTSDLAEDVQLEALGLGPARPLASNDTEEGRRINRRVDVLIAPLQAPGLAH